MKTSCQKTGREPDAVPGEQREHDLTCRQLVHPETWLRRQGSGDPDVLYRGRAVRLMMCIRVDMS